MEAPREDILKMRVGKGQKLGANRHGNATLSQRPFVLERSACSAPRHTLREPQTQVSSASSVASEPLISGGSNSQSQPLPGARRGHWLLRLWLLSF